MKSIQRALEKNRSLGLYTLLVHPWDHGIRTESELNEVINELKKEGYDIFGIPSNTRSFTISWL